MPAVLTILLTAGASAIAAWWGGKLGVRRETEKLAQQRAFDRRLDWYERALKNIEEFKKQTVLVGSALKRNDKGADARVNEYVSFLPKTREIINECYLYARPSTVDAFEKMGAEFRNVPSTSPESHISAVEHLEVVLGIIKRATDQVWAQLITEGRAHLRVEPLEAEYITAAVKSMQ